MSLLEAAFELRYEIEDLDIPLLFAEGRVRYGLRWSDLARAALMSEEILTTQAVHKRYARRVRFMEAAGADQSIAGDEDAFTELWLGAEEAAARTTRH